MPLPGVYVKELRRAFESFTTSGQVNELLATVQGIGQEQAQPVGMGSENKAPVRREDLKLICFDYVWH